VGKEAVDESEDSRRGGVCTVLSGGFKALGERS